MEKKIHESLVRSICLLLGIFVVVGSVRAHSYEDKDDRSNVKADTVLTYLDSPTGKLYMYYAKGRKIQNNPAVVFFFGGGWNSGSPKQFELQAKYLAEYGITVVLADYRTKNNAGTTPKEALMDAKAAMRFLKKNAVSLRIDPEKILADRQADIWLLRLHFVII